MRSHEILRAVERLAPKKDVAVKHNGAVLSFPVPEPLPSADEEMKATVRAMAEEILSEITKSFAQVVAQQVLELSEVKALLRVLSEKQDATTVEIAEGFRSIVNTLALPVRPVFDKQGKLIGALREPGKR